MAEESNTTLKAFAIGGGAMQVIGRMQQARSLRQQARSIRQQSRESAPEIERRGELDVETMKREGRVFGGSQAAAFSAAGIDVGSGSSLIQMEQTARMVSERATDRENEAAFKAKMTRRSGELRAQAAEDQARGQQIAAIGSVVSAAAGFM